jgi:hypothetical protein
MIDVCDPVPIDHCPCNTDALTLDPRLTAQVVPLMGGRSLSSARSLREALG